MDSREAVRIQEQATKAYTDNKTCGGMRPMTYVEKLEHKRDLMISELQEINDMIVFLKQYPVDEIIFERIKKFS